MVRRVVSGERRSPADAWCHNQGTLELTDPRVERTKLHPLLDILVIASCLVLGQQKGDEKSNEITTIPALLRLLAVEACMVTIDAMGCQKEIARTIVEQGADYVLALKSNQGLRHDEVALFFCWAQQRQFAKVPHAFHRTVDGEHGRIEERRYWLVSEMGWLAEAANWLGLRSVGMVEAHRTVGEATTVERRYYLRSLAGDTRQFGQAVRNQWGIENGLHWVLD